MTNEVELPGRFHSLGDGRLHQALSKRHALAVRITSRFEFLTPLSAKPVIALQVHRVMRLRYF